MISTHNRATYLREALESVLAQTFTDYELIICDDASSDSTPDVCQEFAQRDQRIRVIRHEPNVGMIANWNSGLEAAQGLYFAKLDDDNRYLPTFLESTLAALQAHPEASFAFTDEWYIDGQGERQIELTDKCSLRYSRTARPPGLQKDTQLVAAQQAAGINATLFIRKALAEAGGFRAFGGNIADLDVFLNLAGRGGSACYVAQRLCEYRTHPGMGTVDLLTNIKKAKDSISMWEACRFAGQAEALRRAKLATAYTNLSRILSLKEDIQGARQAIKSALRLTPGRFHILAAALTLSLPAPLVAVILRRRFR